MNKNTIVAIATPIGDGGVSILRLSGSNAFSVANKISSKDIFKLQANQLVNHELLDGDQNSLDFGMIVKMVAPKSFTGEDVIELHCHGGHYLTQKILKVCLAAGADLASPGEFSKRAFLNGKMDLTQAEAVQSLISAKNEYALKMASQQLEGKLSQKISQMQKDLIDQAAILEAWVDFPEEGLEFCSMDQIIEKLKQVLERMNQLIDSYDNGKALQKGFSLCLVGRPNVGKSSLMNLLLQKDRAIVTEIAGTTRDTLEDALIINGMNYKLIDTAGIRVTDEVIEKEGICRAQKSMREADLVLLVIDSTQKISQSDLDLIDQLKNKPVLVLYNKADLSKPQQKAPFDNSVEISAKTGSGLKELYQKIPELLLKSNISLDEIYLSSKRHYLALKKSSENVQKVIIGLKQESSPEWLSFDLKDALKELGKIIGMDITQDILSSIFSKFCIGK